MTTDPTGLDDLLSGKIKIDRRRREASVDGVVLRLTRAEYGLLLALISNLGTAMSRRELLTQMWGSDWPSDTSALNIHASRLRRKLEDAGEDASHLKTIHGFGYRWDEDMESRHAPVDPTSAVAIIRPDRVIEWVSDEITALIGWLPEQLVGVHFYDLLKPGEIPSALAARVDLDAGLPSLVVLSLRTPIGDFRPVDAFVDPIIGDDGTVSAFHVRWQPRALALPEPVVRAGDGSELDLVVLTFDRDFTLVNVDPYVEFLGWKPDEIIGDFFSPSGADIQTLSGVVSLMLSRGEHDVAGTLPLHSAAGEIFSLPVATRLLTEEDGVFAGMRSTIYLRGINPNL